MVSLLKLRFHVKLILMSWKTSKMGILPIQDAVIFVFDRFEGYFRSEVFENQNSEPEKVSK